MTRLVYGRNDQLRFDSVLEKQEAIDYILSSPNVKLVLEENQLQGAWGPEKRIQFASESGVPECLKRNMTAGTGSIYGRINCNEFCDELQVIRKARGVE